MAELLIKAKDHWMETLTKEEIDKMNEGELKAYEARTKKGDVIVVRPDGWSWGKLECLPDFLVVKVKETYEEAKKYEDKLYSESINDTKEELLKARKYYINTTEVSLKSLEVKDFEEIVPVELSINEKILEKVI